MPEIWFNGKADKLKETNPSLNIENFRKVCTSKRIATLSIADAGKAVRIMIRHMGKPYLTANRPQGGRGYFTFRNCIWKVNEGNVEEAILATNELFEAGVTDFKITPSGWFSSHIPFDSFVSDFYDGNEQEWVEKITKRVESRHRYEEEQRKQLEEYRLQQAESQRKWEEEYERTRPQREAEAAAAQEKRKQELQEIEAAKAYLAEKKRQQDLKLVEDLTPVREIELED